MSYSINFGLSGRASRSSIIHSLSSRENKHVLLATLSLFLRSKGSWNLPITRIVCTVLSDADWDWKVTRPWYDKITENNPRTHGRSGLYQSKKRLVALPQIAMKRENEPSTFKMATRRLPCSAAWTQDGRGDSEIQKRMICLQLHIIRRHPEASRKWTDRWIEMDFRLRRFLLSSSTRTHTLFMGCLT